MAGRNGQKWGWTLGFLGASVWMLLASLCAFVYTKLAFGAFFLGLFALSVTAVIVLAPWKHPQTRMWRLFLPLYLLQLLGLVVGLQFEAGAIRGREMRPLIQAIVLGGLPLVTLGSQKWSDGEPDPGSLKGDWKTTT